MTNRTIIKISGPDTINFLQGLITNDVTKTKDCLVYAALLTPKGKYIADFFVTRQENALLVDVATSHAAMLEQRLTMYRLRSDVQITETQLIVSRGTGFPPSGALLDPRHTALGWRQISDKDQSDNTDWDALRVTHIIPETGIELTPDTYILEAGFERLNGVDFRKGCYVGQEIAARMKHKTELKKGLTQVWINEAVTVGTKIMTNNKPVGILFTQSGNLALAHLRFDRATSDMQAGSATLRRT